MDKKEINIEELMSELHQTKRRARKAWNLACGLLVFVVVLVTVAAVTKPLGGEWVPYEVRARRFLLVDEQGETRAMLDATKGGPSLTLYDEKGKPHAELSVDEDGSRLTLCDEQGRPRVALSVDEGGPSLSLLDEKGEIRAALIAIKGGPCLSLLDEKGEMRAVLSVDEDGSRLSLNDEKGEIRAVLGTGQTIEPDGKRTIYPESSLRLFGPDGKMIWQAP